MLEQRGVAIGGHSLVRSLREVAVIVTDENGHASGDGRVNLIGGLAPLFHGVVQKDILEHVVRNLGEVRVALLAQLHDRNLDVAAKGIHKLVKELLAALFAKGEL